LHVAGAVSSYGTKIAKKLTNNTLYCLLKNVGYLSYSPHQLNNALLAYVHTGNSHFKLKFIGMPVADGSFGGLTNVSRLAMA